jgi:hypothetical protein
MAFQYGDQYGTAWDRKMGFSKFILAPITLRQKMSYGEATSSPLMFGSVLTKSFSPMVGFG